MGRACFPYFPFSPFAPGTDVICFLQEAWSIYCDFVAVQMHRACQLIGADFMAVEEKSQEITCPLIESQPEMMDMDAATNKRKRRLTTPLDIFEVRRSVRATR